MIIDLRGIDIANPGKGYEELFPYESQRAAVRSTPLALRNPIDSAVVAHAPPSCCGVLLRPVESSEFRERRDVLTSGGGWWVSRSRQESKGRTVCFGTNYRAAPEILHGYNRKVKGDTVEERLDMRCGQKADKFCK